MSNELNKFYTSELIRRGLGDADYIGPYGITTPPKRKIGEIGQGILSGIETGGDFIQYLTSPGEGGLPDKIRDNVIVPAYKYLMSPSSMEIAKKKNEIAQNEKMKENIKNLSLDELFYPDSKKSMSFDPVDVTAQNENIIKIENELGALEENDLTEQIKNLIAPSGVEDSSEAQKIITEAEAQKLKEFRDKEAEIAAAQGKPEVGGEALQKAAAAAEDAFAGGVQQYANDAGINIPTTPNMSKEEALEKYKQEFAKATGIDISGKVDKSSALMAMGLALMQNRAGKGFNVGRILSSVGEAGQAAMPALEKAKDTARASALAAGQYALNQIKADENAAAATRAAHLKHIRAKDLEFFKAKLEAQEKSLAAPETKHPYTESYTVGARPLEMRLLSAIERNPETKALELVTKFQSPETQSTEVLNRYKNAAAGFGLAEELKVVLGALDQASAENSGQVFEILKGRGKNLISVLGLSSDNILYDDATYDYLVEQGQEELAEKYKANPTSLENKAQVAQDALMARFKRFMTQETGNGISVYDSESAKVLTGQIGMFVPLNKNLEYIEQLQGLFGHSLNTLDDLIVDLYDRDFYLSQRAYDKTLKKLDEGMKDVYEPLQLSADSDLTKKVFDVRD